ncbi:Unknown protein [Striga hermonthica]|uniref:Phorbol-ester/DAG-type domain-containing protein n=1 Tax=Striga hermonthica TaxID=68872 RepID=A0A9N7NAG0_STRHE|nr:Unknown protein [Striga hermonthica]
METIEHFAHRHHPLVYIGQDKIQKDRNHNSKPHLCNVCWLPILSSPFYSCINGCDFFLHKPCAQLPDKVDHPYISTFLSLKINPHPNSTCKRCNKLCANIVYTTDIHYRFADYIVHPLCAVQVEIKIEHQSHNEHPLVAVCRDTLSLCDACGENHEGVFFSCKDCNFWIHRDCTLLPSIAKHPSHDHHLVLSYALSADFYRAYILRCDVCGGRFRGKGLYACAVDRDFHAHLKCVSSNMGNFTLADAELLIHLPHREGGYMYSSLAYRNLDNRSDRQKKWEIEKYHNHPLTFHQLTSSSDSSSVEALLMSYSRSLDKGLVCDACIQPIISRPYWECARLDCRYLLHDFCANIPSSVLAFGYRGSLYQDSNKYLFHSTFPCFFCQRPCNGLGYRAYINTYTTAMTDLETNPYTIAMADLEINPYTIAMADLECASAPHATTHSSHEQNYHILILTMQTELIPLSCCRELWPSSPWPFQPSASRTYRCVSCDYAIHAGCAFLPKKVSHKFDKHPLELMFTGSPNGKDECLCEVCEKDIDQQYWFYHCAICEQSFHVECIPTVGLLSKIKFGSTLDVSCHTDHPVALTRMLTVGNQRCSYCSEIIEGFIDDMNFCCSECDFWIHYLCAKSCNKEQYTSRPWYNCRI